LQAKILAILFVPLSQGAEVADEICTSMGQGAELGDSFVAWISESSDEVG
jgi:hypothetical protein